MNQELKPQDTSVPELQEERKRTKQRRKKKSVKFSDVLFWFSMHRQAALFLLPVAAAVFAFLIAPAIGSSVGMAVGSYEGVTKGLIDGYNDGKIDGLSAEDTTAVFVNKLKETQKLQVLLMNLQLTDLYMQPENKKNDPDYAALFAFNGEGVFTVDLAKSEAKKDPESGKIFIHIPQPDFDVYIDDASIEMVDGAEYKAPWYKGNGSTVNGYTGWLNSHEQLDQQAKAEMLRDDGPMEQARASALRQVKQLTDSICKDGTTVEVCFFEGGEG